jgi:hypothetical protein
MEIFIANQHGKCNIGNNNGHHGMALVEV